MTSSTPPKIPSPSHQHTALKQPVPIILLDTYEPSSLLADHTLTSSLPILEPDLNHSTMEHEHESAIAKAPKRAELCCACYKMLNPRDKQEKFSTIVRKQSFEEFKEAALQKCAICSLIWNLTEDYPLAWSQLPIEAWEPMRYQAHSTLSLFLHYFDPVQGKKVSLHLEFIGPEDLSYNMMSLFPEVRTSTSFALDTAFDWFTKCTTSPSHAGCNQSQFRKPGWYPTRLIDIGKQSEANWNLRVLSQDGISDPNASYMTLSYRWSQNPTLLLLGSNIDKFRAGNPICNLPLTFREFFTVARRFSIRYVWIDALCIIQDSRRDWETEAPTMRYVYANSACNVAASASHDPEGGLFRTRDPQSLQPPFVSASLFSDNPNSARNYYVDDPEHWDHKVQYGPLHKRGWVYQEIILAPRVLYFGVNEVLWECFEMLDSEYYSLLNYHPMRARGKYNIPVRTAAGADSQNEPMPLYLLRSWMALVEDYSCCIFTKPSDKLFAFSGIAKLFQDYTSDIYIAGMWKSRMAEMMDWYVDVPQSTLSPTNRAPSWSWASMDGPIQIGRTLRCAKYDIKILDVQFTPGPGSDPTVHVSDAHVRLKAKSALGSFHPIQNYPNQYLLNFGEGRFQKHGSIFLHPDYAGAMTIVNSGKQLTCLLLAEYYFNHFSIENIENIDKWTERGPRTAVSCLILDRLGSDLPIKYRRLGWMEILNPGMISSFLDNVSIAETTII